MLGSTLGAHSYPVLYCRQNLMNYFAAFHFCLRYLRNFVDVNIRRSCVPIFAAALVWMCLRCRCRERSCGEVYLTMTAGSGSATDRLQLNWHGLRSREQALSGRNFGGVFQLVEVERSGFAYGCLLDASVVSRFMSTFCGDTAFVTKMARIPRVGTEPDGHGK